MFNRLKKKLMMTYIISIFIILLLFSFFILLSTYININNEINLELNEFESPKQFNKNDYENNNSFQSKDIFNDSPELFKDDIFLHINDNREIIDVLTVQNVTNDELILLQESIYNNDCGKILLNDTPYLFNVHYDTVKLINVQEYYNIIYNLIRNLIIIDFILVTISFFLGNYLADKALKPIKDNFENQKTFISDASHEIKTPLSVIASCLDLVKENDEDSTKWLEYSINETKRLNKLVSNLLTLSKENITQDSSNYEALNISKSLDLLIAAYEVNLFENNFKLSTNITENLYTNILNDDFTQLFHILIDNAIKYNDNRKKINIKLEDNEKFILLTISNTSDYISKKDINNLFQRFYRQSKSRNKQIEGFGLGLSIAKKIFTKYNLKFNVNYENSEYKIIIKFLKNIS